VEAIYHHEQTPRDPRDWHARHVRATRGETRDTRERRVTTREWHTRDNAHDNAWEQQQMNNYLKAFKLVLIKLINIYIRKSTS
jgi:hypothetical protein